MAHVQTAFNRYVYLFLFLSVSLADISLSLGQNETQKPAAVDIPFVSPVQVVNSTALNKEVSSNRLSVDDIFNSISFGEEANSPPIESEESTLLTDSSVAVRNSIGNMLISLAFVIMIGLGIAWFMRRFVVKDSNLGGGKINLLASYALSPKSKVYLLQIGSQTFLVGEGSNELNLISEVSNHSPKWNEQESLSATGTENMSEQTVPGGFENKLNQWKSALKSKDMQHEVNTSLLLLGGLAQRLRNKREGQ